MNENFNKNLLRKPLVWLLVFSIISLLVGGADIYRGLIIEVGINLSMIFVFVALISMIYGFVSK
ncbi:MAG: hypothetical protein BTN85_1137 [Candidatus Methanohalarchaeum thermophilum]|uniref:Uncharacterized protein n=1 Tax=Methanohalarchaeum thermophilum TaxID=1903181 RepID=A0A1Q6DW80_METT1|nr:MAG: hypothetical protein BTN85_1137 [Candidatus Methanohalarchaeum thermophilum]